MARKGFRQNTITVATSPCVEAVTFLADRWRLQSVGNHRGHFFFFFRNHRSCFLQQRQDIIDSVGHEQIEAEVAADEFECLHVVNEDAKWIPEPLDIRKQDRFAVPAQLNPGDLLDDFFKGSDSARHRDKGVRHLEHLALSFMHITRDNQIIRAPLRVFARYKEFGNDTGYLTAVVENRFGNRAHHADRATAEDQADVVLGKNSAEGVRALNEGQIYARPGAAIDANCSDFAAFFISVHRYACAWHLRHRQGGPLKIHNS